MKKLFLSLFIFSFALFSASAFSEKDIISPSAGTWCNQQALVLAPSDASEVYYSFTGCDPFAYGFAYAGPVLLEEKGDVCVRIGVVETDGTKKEFEVKYTVMAAALSSLENDARTFAENNLIKSPLITYKSGTEFSFPNGFRYSFHKDRNPFISQKLKLDDENSIERFTGIFITDGINNYHSVIRILPAEVSSDESVLRKKELPFVIRDWNNFVFTDKKYIYQIDYEMWNSDYNERIIDRSVAHTVQWQSVDFSANNKVYEYILPPVPETAFASLGEGKVVLEIIGKNEFTFANGLKTLNAASFYGEEAECVYDAPVYMDGILCGKIKIPFVIDYLPPDEPVFTASGNSNFSRNTVALNIARQNDAEVFYAVSKPVYYEEGRNVPSDTEFAVPEEFSEYKGGDIVIKSARGKSSAYKVFAYAMDKYGNKSSVAEQKYIIDEFNFYLGTGSGKTKGDGSFMKPFTSFEQAVKEINSSDGETRLHLLSDVEVSDGNYTITKDCIIYGNGSKLIFKGDSSLTIENAVVQIEDCSLEKRSSLSSPCLMEVKDGNLLLNNCEVSAFYNEDGKLIEAVNSEVKFIDCGFTMQVNRISLCAEFSGSNVNVKGCRFTSIGQTVSAVKVRNCSSVFEGNTFTLIGSICKGVDIAGGNASFNADVFKGESDGKYKNSGTVFRNGSCKVTGLETIFATGF